MSTQAGTLTMTISTCNAHEVVAQAVDLQGAHCDKPFSQLWDEQCSIA